MFARKLNLKILLPIILSLLLVLTGYILILNYVEETLIEQKKETLKDQVYSLYSQIEYYYDLSSRGEMNEEQAKTIVINNVRNALYGKDKKEYFWLIDHNNTMLSHPYFKDSASMMTINPDSWNIMTDLADLALNKGEGYHAYQWQYNDRTDIVEAKISYVKNFEPWEWVIGTGFYINEVNNEVKKLVFYISLVMIILIVLVSALLFVVITKSFEVIKEVDISKNKLEVSEKRFRQIAVNIKSGLLIYDKGKVSFFNDKVSEIFEAEPKLRENFSIGEHCAPEEGIQINKQLDQILNNRKDSGFSFWIKTLKGTLKYIDVKFTFIDNQSKTSAMLISDLTDEKNRAIENEILLQTLGQSPDSVAITDLNGDIIYINKSFEQKSGYSFEEAKGKNTRILKSEKMHPTVYRDLWDTIKKGKLWENQLINKKKDGTFIWEHTKIFPIRDNSDQIIRYAAIKTDITELRNMQQNLKKAQENANASENLKNAFLNNISHEINTPLNAIYGFSNLLKNNPRLSDRELIYLDTVLDGASTLISLFNDIIEYSSIESGNISIKRAEIPLSKFFADIEYNFKLKFKNDDHQNRTIKIEVPPKFKDACLISDRRWIARIYDELISNALKYSDKGDITLSYKISHESIDFSVKDSGVGIPREEQNKIFELFAHGENLFVSLHKGTGIGLNIVRLLVRQLGGKLWFDSRESVGTEFGFSFPSLDVVGYKIDEQVDDGLVSNVFENKSMIIAEDNDYSYDYIKAKIEKDIPNIVRVRTDNDLFNYLDANYKKVDIILLDLYIGYPTSKSLVRSIRTSYGNVPIILMSGIGKEEVNLKEEASIVISKPFSRYELINAMISVIK